MALLCGEPLRYAKALVRAILEARHSSRPYREVRVRPLTEDHPMAATPNHDTRFHLRLLDDGLEALARGLVRTLTDLDSSRTSLDPPDDAGLSVPADERLVSVWHGETGIYGRSA